MPFLTPIRVEKIYFKDLWVLMKPFIYHHAPTKYCDLDVTIEVPISFMTDFASVPRLPLLYAQLGNIGHEAAVIHDYLYRVDSNPVVEKDVADRIFYDALIESGIPEYKASLMYDGVHVGGESSFHVHKVLDTIGEGDN